MRPGGHALVSAAAGLANHGDYPLALRILHECECEAAWQQLTVDGRDDFTGATPPKLHRAEGVLGMGLFAAGRGDGTGTPLDAHGRVRLHNLALLGCAIGKAPLPRAMALLHTMRRRGLPPTRYSYMYGIEACVTSRGGWREAAHLLREAETSGVQLPVSSYAKTLRIFATSSPPWAETLALLEEMRRLRVVLPQDAQSYVLQAGLAGGRGWDTLHQLQRLEFDGGRVLDAEGRPVRSDLAAAVDHRRGPGNGKPPLAARLQGELFCLAAQEGADSDRLPQLICRLRDIHQAPSAPLVHRAIFASRLAPRAKQSWRNLLPLLELANAEGISLNERAFTTVVEMYALQADLPADAAGTAPARRPLALRIERAGDVLEELAAILAMEPLSERSKRRLVRVCTITRPAQSRVEQLLGALQLLPPPRATMEATTGGTQEVVDAATHTMPGLSVGHVSV